MKKFYLVGSASGVAGADIHSGDGPLALAHSRYLIESQPPGIEFEWVKTIRTILSSHLRTDEIVARACQELADETSRLMRDNKPFCVVGGDHSCAIGTWSGVCDVMKDVGDLGLIWIDAHMDSHTPETTESGRIHGMPVACLLGYGYPTLTTIINHQPKFKAKNICLVGVRSYESGEAAFLKAQNVRIYFMEEVKERGIDVVLKEAVQHVSQHTVGFGVSLDLDAIDPNDAPGVDVPEPDGIGGEALCKAMVQVVNNEKFIGSEIVEFDPSRDIHHKTEHLLVRLLNIVASKQG